MRVTIPYVVPAKFGMPAAPLFATTSGPEGMAKDLITGKQVCDDAKTSIFEQRRTCSSHSRVWGSLSDAAEKRQPASDSQSPCTMPTRTPPTFATRSYEQGASTN